MESPFWSRLRGSVGQSLGRAFVWGIGALLAVGIALWAYQSLTSSQGDTTLSSSDSVSVAAAPRPLFSGSGATSTSPSGKKTNRPVNTPEESRGTVTITDTTEGRRPDSTDQEGESTTLLVRQSEPWFPEWRTPRPPVKRIGGQGAVVWTPPPRPLFDLDFAFDLGVGTTPSSPVGLHVGVNVLTIARRIHVGGFVHVSRQGALSAGPKAGTLIRENLQLSIGIDDKRQPTAALTYRF